MALTLLIVVNLLTLLSFTEGFLFDDKPCETFDYIVVGAGSAGSTVASRLSEDGKNRVLLLEAGGDPTPILTDIPCAAVFNQGSDIDWQYETVPQKYSCKALIDNKMYLPSGKTLGGTSSINEMLYVRGNKRNYDKWESLGATGWSYKDVLPFFLKSEGNTDAEFANSEYHNTKGPLVVSIPKFHTPLQDAFLQSMQEMGYNMVDYNGERQTGCSRLQTTIKDGSRWSTKKAFLDPAKNRQNLVIKKNSHVFKIDFDDNKKATGVNYYGKALLGLLPKTSKACATKEIIVSCGAIRSPQLLMLSGIGPAEDLQSFNIPVISDLPGVGKNLKDHVGPLLAVKINDSVSLEFPKLLSLSSFTDYFTKKTGPLTTPSTAEGIGFINTKYSDPSVDDPDIELFQSSLTYLFRETRPDVKVQVYPQTLPDSFMLYPIQTHVRSAGEIKLKTNNSLDNPIIDTNYLSDEMDFLILVDGLNFTLDLIKRGPYQKYNPKVIPVPGCKDPIGSEAWLNCTVRFYTYSGYHLCGTCKMGQVSDSMTVVDPRLRVKGVTGLRVADASIMPDIVYANTNAAAIMIGEKAADMIGQDNP